MKVVLKHTRLLDEGDECAFDGTITINMPMHEERQMILTTIGALDATKSNSKDDDESQKEKAKVSLEIMAKASAKVRGYVVECDLHDAEGTVLKTPEELWSHPDAEILVNALISKFLNGFTTKKKNAS